MYSLVLEVGPRARDPPQPAPSRETPARGVVQVEAVAVADAGDAAEERAAAESGRLYVGGARNTTEEAAVEAYEAQDAECREGGREDELARVVGGKVGGPGGGFVFLRGIG